MHVKNHDLDRYTIWDFALVLMIFFMVMAILYKSMNAEGKTPSCEDYGLETGSVHFQKKTKILKLECE